MFKKRNYFPLITIFFFAFVLCSCKGGYYSSKVRKLHSGMSNSDVVAELGKPYGTVNGDIAYYDEGADTILAIEPSEHGDCKWILFEVSAPPITDENVLLKVRESSDNSSVVGIVSTIHRIP